MNIRIMSFGLIWLSILPLIPLNYSNAQSVNSDTSTGSKSTIVGPLELTPRKGFETLSQEKNKVCLDSRIKFTIANKSASDVRIALFSEGISGTDSYGASMFRGGIYMTVYGVTSWNSSRRSWTRDLEKKRQEMTLLSAGNSVTVQINSKSKKCIEDPNSNVRAMHRPDKYSLSGSIGIIDSDGNPETQGFSFDEIPLQVVAY